MKSYQDGCNRGNVKGRTIIIEKERGKNSYYSGFTRDRYTILAVDTLDKEDPAHYHVYGIEWSESYLLLFMNDRVVMQANRIRDQAGDIVTSVHQPYYLPFDHPFNLLLHMNVHKDYLGDGSEWNSSALEIDYVRVFGDESSEFIQELRVINEVTTSSLPLIISMSLVVVSIVVIVILIAIIWKRKQTYIDQDQNIDNYDDIDLNDNRYAEYKIEHDYETASDFEEENNTLAQINDYLEISNL